jgi:DNA polymerase-3 subunit beta
MEFIVNKSDLFRELAAVISAVERKTTIPVLANVLLTAGNGLLNLSATDLDCSLRTSCPAGVAVEGSITLPAKKLLDHVKLLAEGDIHFVLAENNWVNIKAGRSKTKMIGFAASNFPALPAFPADGGIQLPIPMLEVLIQKTIFAVSTEESRYTLNGAQLEIAHNMVLMVATDGHRLGFLKIDRPLAGFVADAKVLIPKKALLNIQTLIAPFKDGTVIFAHDDNTLFFKLSNRVLTSRKMTGTFPHYAAIMPKDASTSVVIDSNTLRDSLQRVALFADERSMNVRMYFANNTLVLSAHNTEDGETEETLDVEYTAPPVTTAFNCTYIRDILKSIPESDRVRLSLKDKSSAVEFQPVTGMELTTNRQIVMPMRA